MKFDVKLPQFAVLTGRRILMPAAVFRTNKKYSFEHVQRVHPVYFPYPWQEINETTVSLPPGYEVASCCQARVSGFWQLRTLFQQHGWRPKAPAAR